VYCGGFGVYSTVLGLGVLYCMGVGVLRWDGRYVLWTVARQGMLDGSGYTQVVRGCPFVYLGVLRWSGCAVMGLLPYPVDAPVLAASLPTSH
jgi:hypothetical protein